MCPSKKDTFGTFGQTEDFAPVKFKPLRAEFAKGSMPNSIARVNRDSTWARWRRGYELATATSYTNAFDYPFTYTVPLPSGVTAPSGTNPAVPGVFRGFPTSQREFGMHWAGVRVAGSLRFDHIRDHTGTPASIASVTEDADYYYVKLTGDWSNANPLPPPLYIPVPGLPDGVKSINGEILEDRILVQNGVPITRKTLDPTTQKKYGYTQFILIDLDPFTGVLTFKKDGSVQATFDSSLVTPSTQPPSVGRFLMTGSRYCCTCQDFTQRDYAFMSNLGNRKKVYFPVTKVATIKPGRFEVVTSSGTVDNNAMVNPLRPNPDRSLSIISPAVEYNLPETTTPTANTIPTTTRDNPGVFRDFGYISAQKNSFPDYQDYTSTNNQITSLHDYWTPLLDEQRYCKHIYSMKFSEGVFPPEPSDLPVEPESIAEWEQDLVRVADKKDKTSYYEDMRLSLAYMDTPPSNCQSPTMLPMMQKLFNIPASFVKLEGFNMLDKNGSYYNPTEGGSPGI